LASVDTSPARGVANSAWINIELGCDVFVSIASEDKLEHLLA
jgi:hypothetical protein